MCHSTDHVEERQVLALADELLELNPLVLGRVDSSGILSASVEQDLSVSYRPNLSGEALRTMEPDFAFCKY
jgi:hypothetical protein